MTAPSSPKPEEGIPPAQAPGSVTPPPPGSPAPAEQAPLTPAPAPAPTPGGATPVDPDDDDLEGEDPDEEDDDEDEDDEPDPKARLGTRVNIDTPEHAQMRTGYLSGLLVGLTAARLSPLVAEGLAASLTTSIATEYKIPPTVRHQIQAGVEADAHAVLQDYLRAEGTPVV
jgi:hypothetical protein